VLYELVKTILAIEANTALINLCSNILGKMISLKDNNFKYIALRTLQIVAKTDLPSVQKHKNTILECMKDNDISIQRRALDLVYVILNTTNIKHIIKECLNFLVVAENEIKVELTSKVKII
jgi:AP-1 complex subunit gamma-1